MNTTLTPGSTAELVEAVRCSGRVLAVGGGTKPRLSGAATRVSVAGLRGIVEYEPSEFTVTAWAGTPVRELAEVLQGRGQFLPFDPFLVDAGATLGGTVASGLSGPGRFRFGGLRDFILGVRFIDGTGRLLRSGGKVVKNAAGFDLPKFFTGSLGRFGVLVELTFKVFPARAATLTCRLRGGSIEQTAQVFTDLARSKFEPDAIDLPPEEDGTLVRLAGPMPAIEAMSRELLARWPGTRLPPDEADRAWSHLREFAWAHPNGPLAKVVLNACALPAFRQALDPIAGLRVHLSSAGDVAFVSLPDMSSFETLNAELLTLKLSGLTLRGDAPLRCGVRRNPQVAQAVKAALDPEGRFPGLED
jgi:glycolate oxidase FAD binding subunit